MQNLTSPERANLTDGEYKDLGAGRVGLPEGTRLELLSRLTAEEKTLLPAKPKYFAKPSCKRCHGRGHQGYAEVLVKDGGRQIKTRQQIRCGCLMVLIKNRPAEARQ